MDSRSSMSSTNSKNSANHTAGQSDSAELKMTVSPVCQKNGVKVAYVSFTDGKRVAEGEIPLCRITMSKGFSEGEVEQLQDYMKRELTSLKKMAARINVLDAFMGTHR